MKLGRSFGRWLAAFGAGVLPLASAVSAVADTAEGFPDLSQYTAVPLDGYVSDFGISGGVVFGTPDGLVCGLHGDRGGCDGPEIPGFPAASARPAPPGTQCPLESARFGPDAGFVFVYHECGVVDRPKLLSPGQKISVQTSSATPTQTCAVGENRLTACTDGTHGFVLQPSGSWVF